jgi:hypothetical protein
MAFLADLPASLTKLCTNNGCPGMADPAYCKPPPSPKLPGPKIPKPEAAALHESDNLPVDSERWKGPMEESVLARECECDEVYKPEEGIFWGEWRY